MYKRLDMYMRHGMYDETCYETHIFKFPKTKAKDPPPRGKVMSQKANKLQAPILDNLIYSRRPFLKKVINSSEMNINSCER